MTTRELTTQHVNAILPRWYVRYMVLVQDDPSKSDYEFWIEDVMINIFIHEEIGADGVTTVTLFEQFAEIADILLD